mgnify:CR=1 FL=1
MTHYTRGKVNRNPVNKSILITTKYASDMGLSANTLFSLDTTCRITCIMEKRQTPPTRTHGGGGNKYIPPSPKNEAHA